MTEENLTKDLVDALKSLNESATFAMSRGGRELFHTNFLAYILEIESTPENLQKHPYTLAVKGLIIEQLFSKGSRPKNVIAFRERKSLDLVIIPDPRCRSSFGDKNEIIVIEAKLKSIPTTEQLKKYDDNLDKGFVLEIFDELSVISDESGEKFQVDKIHYKVPPKKRTSVTSIELDLKDDKNKTLKKSDVTLKKFLLAPSNISLNHDGWTSLCWRSFLNEIRYKNDTSIQKSNELLDLLVNDYLESTENILNLVEEVSKETDRFLDGKSSFKELNGFLNNDKFRGARLHDLVGKVSFHKLNLSLLKSIKRSEILQSKLNDLPSGFELSSYSFYFRSIPGLGIEFKKNLKEGKKTKKISIGIQLQGDSYRHYIDRENFESQKDILNTCADQVIEWMESVGEKKLEIKKSGKEIPDKKFRIFDANRFVYLRKELDKELDKITYSKLCNLFIESLIGAAQCLDNKDFICKLED